MIKRTFGDVKEELRRVAGQTGLLVDDDRLRVAVNLVQERLCTLGEWPYQYARVKFRQRGGLVALPTQYEAIVHSAINRQPVEVQPPWFEFLEYGPGPFQRNEWCNYGADLGESPVYVQPGSRGATVTVTSTVGSDTGTVTVIGHDLNQVALQVDYALPDASSAHQWSRITQVIKPLTTGTVVLSLTDDFGTQTVAADYRARDRNPGFRLYRFTAIADDQTKFVDAIVRRRYHDIVADSDELFVTNLNALRLGVKAVALLDKGEIAESEAAFAAAAQILKDESSHYRARRAPAPVNVTRVAAMTERTDIF